jgi:hypothetical protein
VVLLMRRFVQKPQQRPRPGHRENDRRSREDATVKLMETREAVGRPLPGAIFHAYSGPSVLTGGVGSGPRPRARRFTPAGFLFSPRARTKAQFNGVDRLRTYISFIRCFGES